MTLQPALKPFRQLMTVDLKFTILGCGSSPGVPRPNGDWGACDPLEPKNRRRRASLLVERISENGRTTVVIDTGPDFREQMISAKVNHIDGVVYTHAHADHIHGIDDLRTFVITQRQTIPVYCDDRTFVRLMESFGYCFETPIGSNYPPIVKRHTISAGTPFEVFGEGGAIRFEPFTLEHGSITILGFRIGNFAYCTDTSNIPETSIPALQNLDCLILDALQYIYHPSHLSLEQALEWIEQLKPKHAVLTHMHIPLDYQTVMAETPDHVEPGHDGYIFQSILHNNIR